uniref:Uncharacterized protein n=1 Tax=Kalanchoe fedtschenkoi TaxID=63787 RepID=A0A7N0UHV8_KALFE
MAKLAVAAALLVLWLVLATSPATALANTNCGVSPGKKTGKECRTCIVDQLKFGCPKCVPLLRCMARCLWSGTARDKCGKRCDCGGAKPGLGECKRCMSRCKCSCVVRSMS